MSHQGHRCYAVELTAVRSVDLVMTLPRMTAPVHQCLKTDASRCWRRDCCCCRPGIVLQALQDQTAAVPSFACCQGRSLLKCPDVPQLAITLQRFAPLMFTYTQASITLLSVHASCAFAFIRRRIWVALGGCTTGGGNLRCGHSRCLPRGFTGTYLHEVVFSRSADLSKSDCGRWR